MIAASNWLLAVQLLTICYRLTHYKALVSQEEWKEYRCPE